jgi:hypothetical protein
MINPNLRLHKIGIIDSINVSMPSMTVVKVVVNGITLDYTTFRPWKRRLKIGDKIKCAIQYSILNDGYYIKDLNRRVK